MRNIAIITQTWQSEFLMDTQQWLMVPDQGTKYKENPSSQYGGMHDDRWTDRQMAGLTDWTYSYIP